jgi:pilus assembly protein CpaF
VDNSAGFQTETGMILVMSDSISRIVGAVRAKAHDNAGLASGIQPDLEKLLREEILREEVHNSGEPLTDEELKNLAMAELAGFGALQPLLEDSSIEEIWINSPTEVFVARNGVAELTNLSFSAAQVRDLVERMLQTSGRRVDMSSPFVDATLPDGSRLHVTIPDITSKHWAVNIRKFSKNIRDLGHLVESGSLLSVVQPRRGRQQCSTRCCVHPAKTTASSRLKKPLSSTLMHVIV